MVVFVACIETHCLSEKASNDISYSVKFTETGTRNTPFSAPFLAGETSPEAEDNASEDDENILEFPVISFSIHSAPGDFQNLDSSLLSGSLSLPFSPPEVHA